MLHSAQITQEVLKERIRQQLKEGWSPQHDDQHSGGEIALAAACYAAPQKVYISADPEKPDQVEDAWPWEVNWDKRTKHDRRRQLVIAAALIIAEIERLDRHEDNDSST